jgi:hypothetical protein
MSQTANACSKRQRKFLERENPKQERRAYTVLIVIVLLIFCAFPFSRVSDSEEFVTVREVVERATLLPVISATGLAYFMGLLSR